MRLSTFIHDTLYEIALGVQLGRARSRELVAIAPKAIDGESVAETTYVDFDVAVVVGEDTTITKGASGKGGAEIQVASLFKANMAAGGNLDTSAKTSSEQTHRITFKVPIYMNAHFRDNVEGAVHDEALLAAHGIDRLSGDGAGD